MAGLCPGMGEERRMGRIQLLTAGEKKENGIFFISL